MAMLSGITTGASVPLMQPGIASGPTCHPAHMHALNSTWLFNRLLSYKTDVFLQSLTCRTWQSVLTVITIMGLQAATELRNGPTVFMVVTHTMCEHNT